MLSTLENILIRFNKHIKFDFTPSCWREWYGDMQTLKTKEINSFIDELKYFKNKQNDLLNFILLLKKHKLTDLRFNNTILFSQMTHCEANQSNERKNWENFHLKMEQMYRMLHEEKAYMIDFEGKMSLVVEQIDSADEKEFNNILNEIFEIIYIMRRGENVKIGRTKNLKDRKKSISTNNNDVEVICCFLSFQQEKLELAAHKKFSDYRKKGEWFDKSNLAEYVRFLKEKSLSFCFSKQKLEEIDSILNFVNLKFELN